MKRSIIIPCHGAKTARLKAFLDSIENLYDIKIFICVTDQPELVVFQRIFGTHKHVDAIEYIVCADYLNNIGFALKAVNKGIINIKKFVSLNYIKALDYDWSMVIDCDTLVIGDLNQMYDKLILNYNKKLFLGSPCPDGSFSNINTVCRNHFKGHDKDIIMKKTDNIYSWFHDAPLYKISDYDDFETYMIDHYGSFHNFIGSLTWHSFDHILFMYFLLLRDDYTMVNLATIGIKAISEKLSMEEHDKIMIELEYEPVWVPHVLKVRKNDVSKFYMLAHTDRVN